MGEGPQQETRDFSRPEGHRKDTKSGRVTVGKELRNTDLKA